MIALLAVLAALSAPPTDPPGLPTIPPPLPSYYTDGSGVQYQCNPSGFVCLPTRQGLPGGFR